MSNSILNVINFKSPQDYKKIWLLQKELVKKRINNEITDHLILVEHNHVITTGRHADFKNLKIDEKELKKRGISIYKIERGGDITYHGPGQLVGYPIIKINSAIAGLRKFIHMLEKALQKTIAFYGIDTYTSDKYVGVWHKNEKIVAIGVAFKKWVSFHGFAFNVNTDLSYFNLIIPCGLKDKGVTSLEKLLGHKVPIDEVKQRFIQSFKEVFGYEEINEETIE